LCNCLHSYAQLVGKFNALHVAQHFSIDCFLGFVYILANITYSYNNL